MIYQETGLLIRETVNFIRGCCCCVHSVSGSINGVGKPSISEVETRDITTGGDGCGFR